MENTQHTLSTVLEDIRHSVGFTGPSGAWFFYKHGYLTDLRISSMHSVRRITHCQTQFKTGNMPLHVGWALSEFNQFNDCNTSLYVYTGDVMLVRTRFTVAADVSHNQWYYAAKSRGSAGHYIFKYAQLGEPADHLEILRRLRTNTLYVYLVNKARSSLFHTYVSDSIDTSSKYTSYASFSGYTSRCPSASTT